MEKMINSLSELQQVLLTLVLNLIIYGGIVKMAIIVWKKAKLAKRKKL